MKSSALNRSAIYWGEVYHRRTGNIEHAFKHRLPWFLFDLQDLAIRERHGSFALLNVNAPGVFSFCDADHGPRDGSSFRGWLDDLLAEHGEHHLRYQVLTMPRVFGYVFNPISVVYAFDCSNELRAIVYEVHNTFGDSHSYVHVLRDGITRHESRKQLHVSPFFGMSGNYQFSITRPGPDLSIGITYTNSDGSVLRAGFKGVRSPPDRRELLRVLALAPLATLAVTANIHWQALKLWIKGVPVHPNPHKATSIAR